MSNGDYRPSMAERSIGRTVREWRNQRGLSLAEAGELLGISAAKLSLMENALGPMDPAEIIAAGLAYRMKGAAWKQLVKLAVGDRNLRAAEDVTQIYPQVSVLRAYADNAIPRLLHSPGYADRMDSDNDPLEVKVVVTADAISRFAGESPGTSAPLIELVRLAERGRLSVQVLLEPSEEPRSPGAAFTFLSFLHKQHNDVVFAEREQEQEGSYIEDPVVCQLMSQAFEQLQRAALDPQQSINFIAESAERTRR